MKRAVIIDVSEDKMPAFNQIMDLFAANDIRVISGSYHDGDSEMDALPHFEYKCSCGWQKVTAIAIERCPRCGMDDIDVSPDGMVDRSERIPSFIKNLTK